MRGLQLKLTAAFLIVGLLGVAVGAVVASHRASGAFREFTFTRNQEGLVTSLVAYYEENRSWDNLPGVFPPPGPMGGAAPGIPLREPSTLMVTDASGRVVVSGPGRRVGDLLSEETLSDATPLESGGSTVGWLVVPEDAFARTRGEEQFLGQLNTALIIGSLGAAVLSIALGTFLARSLTRPLQDLTEATRAVADGDLQRQVKVRSRDEVGVLAASFNRMSAALDRSQRLRRQMTADIAHDLRTPLSIIVGHLDAVDEGVLPPDTQTINIMRDEAMRLSHLIEDLRTLSLADAGELPLSRSPIEPGTLLQHSSMTHHPAAKARGIDLGVEVDPGLPVLSLDPERMTQVLGNLIDNALFHTPTGGRILLSAKANGKGVEIRVHDSGPGIPQDELELVFERLHRSDASRQRNAAGSGLGLAIAKSIVEAHGGTIHAESAPGEGTAIVVNLPGGADS